MPKVNMKLPNPSRPERDIVLPTVQGVPVKELREEYEKLGKAYKRIKTGAFCHYCNRFMGRRDNFYMDERTKSGLSPICRTCVTRVATNYNDDTGKGHVTKESIIEACRLLNRVFDDRAYDNAEKEAEIHGLLKEDDNSAIWGRYIKNIQTLTQYMGLSFKDSTHLKYKANTFTPTAGADDDMSDAAHEELVEQYRRNRMDVIKSVGYDPFKNYPITKHKPVLYAQLNSFIDDETKNDGMKMNAVIQIVKRMNQAEQINDQLDLYVNDFEKMAENMGLIDKMTNSSKKLIDIVNALAKDNGISVNFNNNKSKGANTLSGKIKKLTEIGLREAKINSFDIGTCQGMQQVAEISEKAIRNQIGMDENIAQEIKDIKVELVQKLSKERDQAVEEARKLLVENYDLKQFLLSKGLVNENFEVIENGVN